MSKGKLAKFADMAQNPLVVECPFHVMEQGDFPLKGKWHKEFFHNENPIILELGCGRGEYTVGLGRVHNDYNYIGVDIKGARMWTGAEDALKSGMKNVAFLRTNIEFIDRFFSPNEVSEIWLTFSDPQMKKATKRLSSTFFLQRYRRLLKDNGLVHLKTDSNFLFTYTREMLKANHLEPMLCTEDLYHTVPPSDGGWQGADSIQTYYEQMWRERGIAIKYLCFKLPAKGELTEPDVEIPLDEYRSYNRSKRSGNTTAK